MRRLKQCGIVILIAMSAALVLAQTETFPRWRIVGGTGGVPVEVSSSNGLLVTTTGTAAAADSGLASTLPRYRLAGGTTGNLAEVDSTGHLLVAPASGSGLASTGSSLAQFAPTTSAELAGVLSDEVGTGSVVLQDTPIFTSVLSVTRANGARQLQLGIDSSTYGGFFWSRDQGNLAIGAGNYFDGSNYIASHTTGSALYLGSTLAFATFTGATPGQTTTLTNVFTISNTGQANLPGTNSLLFGAASSSGALLRYNNATGQVIVRRGDDATFGAFVSGSAANQLVGVTTLTTLTGDVATGTNTVGQSLTVTAPTGTGTGNLGTIPLKASTGKQVSGSSAHATSTLLTIGNTQTAHPGTSGALIHASAVTWTDFNTANSGVAAVASAYVFAQPTFAATGTSVTTTKAATVSILDAPTNGTNMTLSTSFALDVVAGAVRIGDLAATGAATGKTQICSDSTGKLFRSASGYSCETTNTGPGTVMELIYCGQAAENGTIYLSPAAGINGATIGARPELASATCDALDGATESTQDIIIFPQNAFRVTGMYCMQNGAEVLAGGETMIFTYRANAANVTPSVTCTISAAQTGCASAVVTTTDVAANLPTAMQLVMSSNNSDQDAWCSVSILVQP